MRKLLIILIALAFVLPTSAQVIVKDNFELFSTKACTLGGIASDFVNNPNYASDSTFAMSNIIDFTIPVYGPAGFKYELFADRAWLELSYTDSGSAGAGPSLNDSVIVFIYAVGPDGGLSYDVIDTLAFVMTTGALNDPEIAEISPYGWPKFCNSATLTNYHPKNVADGDSLVIWASHLPYQAKFKVCGDCSTAKLVPSTPWCDNFDDTCVFQARLILEANRSSVPGW